MRRYILGLGVSLIIGAIASGIFTYSDWRTETQLKKDGRDGIAVITEKETRTGRRGSVSYYITYSFVIGSTTYTEEESISKVDWDALQLGQQIAIRYSASKPDMSVIAGGEPNVHNQLVLSLVIGIAGLFVLVLTEIFGNR